VAPIAGAADGFSASVAGSGRARPCRRCAKASLGPHARCLVHARAGTDADLSWPHPPKPDICFRRFDRGWTEIVTSWLWIIFTVLAAGGQTLRNAMQKELTATLGTVGATHVRFLYGLPFGLLFLIVLLVASGHGLPALNPMMLIWTLIGALTQIAGTALLLAAMQERSFVVTTALVKTEPVQVALFGLVFLGDHLSLAVALAILIATAGVLVMSWPRRASLEALSWQGAALGVGSGALFGMSAIGYRGGILALEAPNFAVNASTTLTAGLLIQVALLTGYLLWRDRDTLIALFRAWRPSIMAGFMGAFASQMWFLAFAVETAARVRTLALVEILFAQALSRSVFKQGLASREALGIGLVVAGVILLLNG
jgi:drug/metabolite transporter (DMT)-like permease